MDSIFVIELEPTAFLNRKSDKTNWKVNVIASFFFPLPLPIFLGQNPCCPWAGPWYRAFSGWVPSELSKELSEHIS